MDKEQFLKEFGKDYGYPNGPKTIDEIRATEFKRLANGNVYLDHAGATMYSEEQMEAIFKDLTSNVFGNPHSQSNSSVSTSEIIGECRQLVLDYCNASAKEYKCIFTSGATAALKMVGEAFPWGTQSYFVYTMENHNSVIGIREYALNHGVAAVAVDVEEIVDLETSSIDKRTLFKVSQHAIQRRNDSGGKDEGSAENTRHLFAFPSECNFSGSRFNLDVIKAVKEHPEDLFKDAISTKGCWLVLIDAAKGCATEPPDLSKYPADFVALSFYKIFGYPTGLGALIVRNEAAKLLKKTYFGGGTVAATIADIDFVKFRDGIEESFEDGTASFLSIGSIRHGFKILNTRTISLISRHTSSLTTYLRRVLSSLKHENGADVCIIYGGDSMKGSIVSFNLKRPDGSWFGYREVEKLASLSGIHLRDVFVILVLARSTLAFLTWSFFQTLRLVMSAGMILMLLMESQLELLECHLVTCQHSRRLSMSAGKPMLVDFIVNSFVVLPTPISDRCLLRESYNFVIKAPERMHKTTDLYLKSIIVYPIKSCAGFCVDSWPLSITGLLHDRQWLLRSPSGEVLTQKKAPEMSLISTSIDLGRDILFVESPRCKSKLQILLKSASYCYEREEIDLRDHRYEVQCYNQEVNSWFSDAIGRPCMLCRSLASNGLTKQKTSGMCRDVESSLSFVNEAQFLLISEASVMELNYRLKSKSSQVLEAPIVQVSAMRFRPNLVISGGEPYDEDLWRGAQIGSKYFASLGGCNRCQMINFDQKSEHVHKTNEPLATLASYRRVKGRILFGILLRVENSNLENQDSNSWLKVGQEIYPEMK